MNAIYLVIDLNTSTFLPGWPSTITGSPVLSSSPWDVATVCPPISAAAVVWVGSRRMGLPCRPLSPTPSRPGAEGRACGCPSIPSWSRITWNETKDTLQGISPDKRILGVIYSTKTIWYCRKFLLQSTRYSWTCVELQQ